MSELGEQITKLSDALRLNKDIVYKNKKIMHVYLGGMNMNTGDVVIRYSDLETESVDVMDLQVIE